jgi:metallophosphoesterase (TIGR00282 family)
MNILCIGDIIGKPGRKAVAALLPGLRQEHGIDYVIANGENAAGGIGLTPETAEELFQAGVDVITSGNHIWAQKEIFPCLERGDTPILRPANYPPGVPGRGWLVFKKRMVVANLIGRVFIGNYDDPFRGMDKILAELPAEPKVIIIDFHAEATSEKVALGRYLDGRVSALLGTHTHIGTIDACILPGGTAYVSDIGMTGPKESVIGDDIDAVLGRFLSQIPNRLTVGHGSVIFNGILVRVNEKTGKATAIERISREIGP